MNDYSDNRQTRRGASRSRHLLQALDATPNRSEFLRSPGDYLKPEAIDLVLKPALVSPRS